MVVLTRQQLCWSQKMIVRTPGIALPRRRGDGVLRRSGSKVNDLVIASIHQF